MSRVNIENAIKWESLFGNFFKFLFQSAQSFYDLWTLIKSDDPSM
jgi:hypothetical protein